MQNTLDPFAPEAVDQIILDEFDAVLDVPGRAVRERWVGVDAFAADRLMLVDKPSDSVRIVIVTSGNRSLDSVRHRRGGHHGSSGSQH